MKWFRIWQYSLGGYSDEKTEPYDTHITIVRTIIVGVNFMTCFFIMANTVRHW
jgi:hypothetical protein